MSPTQRIETLKNAPPDSWVAFSADEKRLVATGFSYEEVVSKAEEQGETEPVVVKVPHDWTPLVLGR